ncbi:MAG: hypothetical protein KF894_23680 [Labilithrix sp.]|nr:hypothetical protein [Labilithrix sp.]
MKYVVAFGGSRRGLAALPAGTTRTSVAAECREVALELMTGIADGWDKGDLARWLAGPYARVTRHCRHGERTFAEPADAGAGGSVEPAAIETLLTSTRGRLLAALEKAALSGGALAFAGEIVARGLVRRAVDTRGEDTWLPVDGPRTGLRDRVSALFVADYLNAPDAYAALYVCHRCEDVVFDEDARTLGMCSRHRRMSEIEIRTGARGASRAVGDG